MVTGIVFAIISQKFKNLANNQFLYHVQRSVCVGDTWTSKAWLVSDWCCWQPEAKLLTRQTIEYCKHQNIMNGADGGDTLTKASTKVFVCNWKIPLKVINVCRTLWCNYCGNWCHLLVSDDMCCLSSLADPNMQLLRIYPMFLYGTS